MIERNQAGKVKLFFTESNICVGSFEEVTGNDSLKSEYIRIPSHCDPVGKSHREIMENAIFFRAD